MRILHTLLLILVSTMAVSTHAQEKSPWWKPFAGKSETGDTEMVRKSSFFGGSATPSKLVSLPKLPWFSKGEQAVAEKKVAPKTASALDKVSRTTRQWWASTTDVLNPFSEKPKPQQQGYQPQNQTEASSGLFDWFSTPQAEPEPTTVNDFLRKPRPKY